MSGGRQPKAGWAAPSASVIPIPAPRAVQDGDYVTYWPQPGYPRAGRDKLGGWRCSDLPRGSPEFGNLSTGCGEEGGEAEMLAASHPPCTQHPEAIKELQPRWPRAFPGRSAWEQMVKGLIEFGCSGQEAIRRSRKWRRGWGCHSATQEPGAGVRNSGNPLKQALGCCSRDRAGWLRGANIPAALSPRMLRGWGETSKGTGSRSHGLVPACRHLQRQQGHRHSP